MADPFQMTDILSRYQHQIDRTRSAPINKESVGDNELENACRDFEALFLGYMMKEMRKTVPDDGLFSGGRAEQMYTAMLDDETAKSITRHNGLGLAPMLYRQLTFEKEK